MSIATVHEVLSYNGIESVGMSRIIGKLSKMLVYGIADCDVKLELAVEDVELESHQAVSLALILTELIQNSLKHAFIGRTQGTIGVVLRSDGNQLVMTVADDGAGADRMAGSDSLGLEIVKNLK